MRPSFRSKLPDVGTTIFTVMSRRARELGALNLGQGFPDYPIDPRLTQLLAQAMAEGHNQYAPMEGVIELRQRIAQKLLASYGLTVDPADQVTVTVGATESIYSAIQAVVGPGDEAIAFDPAYDSYEPAVRLAGGHCLRLPLAQPGFRYDWERVRAAVNERTRHRGAVRRGIRARGVRRRPAPVRADAPGARRAQLCGVFLRQDPARHRP